MTCERFMRLNLARQPDFLQAPGSGRRTGGGPADGQGSHPRELLKCLPRRKQARLAYQSSESCTPLPSGGTKRSSRSGMLRLVMPSLFVAISKRRAICQA